MFIVAAFDAVVGVAHSAIEGLSTLLTPTLGGLAAAVAIVAFTILVRLLVSPLSWLQARAAKRGTALAPEIAKLREKHKNDSMTLATETLALQRANGAGPGMSLLPALVQAPFFMIMFRLVRPGSGTPSGLLSGDLFGVPLTAHLAGGLPIFAVLIALTAALATWSSRRTRKSMAAAQVAQASSAAIVPAKTAAPARKSSGAAPAVKAASGGKAGLARKSAGRAARPSAGGAARPSAASTAPSAADAAGPLIGRMMTFLPFVTVLTVAYLPLAGALYLVTSTAWTALETALWRRPVQAGNR